MVINLSRPDITQKEIDAVVETLQSGQLALGPKLKEFESKLANIAKTKYASAVSNGTNGLHLIVKALKIGEGDAVFVPSFTFISSANCFIYEGAYPIFLDIEDETYNLDVKYLKNYIENNTTFEDGKLIDKNTHKHIKAIVGVHIFGHPFDVDEVLNICKKYNMYLIEDSAEAIGSEYKGIPVGGFGEASIFAFYPNKQITTGEGGVITTNNEQYFQLFESLKNQGRGSDMQRLSHDKIGYNYRLSEIAASLGIIQVDRLEEIISKREKVALLYEKYLGDYPELLKLPVKKDYCTKRSRFVYVIRITNNKLANDIIMKLHDFGIQSKNYFSPVHLQKVYKENYGMKRGMLPVTEAVSDKSIALPFYNNLSENDIKFVSENLIYLLNN